MFERLASLAIRWPRTVVAVGIIVIAGAGVYASGITKDLTTVNGFIVPGSESDRVASQLASNFGVKPTSGLVLFTSKTGLSATDPKFRAETGRLLAPLVSPDAKIIADNGTPATAGLVSTDGKASYAAVTLTGSVSHQYSVLMAWEKAANSSLVGIQLGGTAVAQQQSQTQVEHDLRRAEAISLPVLSVLLLILFRSVVAAALPLILGIAAIIGGIGVTRLLAQVTNVDQYSLNVITLLGLGLSVDYSLLMVSRFREELALLAPGAEVRLAVRRTVLTAGRTIFFSALTVIVSLLSLLIFPISFLHSIGLGGASAIVTAAVAALTILPALLHLLGPNVNRLRVVRTKPKAAGSITVWNRLGKAVVGHPWWAIIGSVAIITVLAYPLTQARFVTQSYRFLPTGSSARTVAQTLGEDFPARGSEMDIIVHLGQPAASAGGQAALADAVSRIKGVSGLTSIGAPQLAGDSANIRASTSTDDRIARDTVNSVRKVILPSGTIEVGGDAAALNDTLHALEHRAPIAGLIIAVAMFVLLGLLVRSLVIPLQAVVINSFALLAALGLLVFVFQEGHIGLLHWFSPTAGLDPTIPVLILAIAFGLSMDYGAFLYSRMREEYSLSNDPDAAIVASLGHTGGIITAAAVLLVVVVGAFASSQSAFIQQIGLGLSAAILLDAFVVRLFLVPAVMQQFGRVSWLAPKWMNRWQIRHN